ncbi:hypothetical protein [Rubrivirga sp. IMCC45206]|uniref:hypothetical protein n=1 Tax=Rubrivirga sp. IMCC45206 TaxID=3391614 RepID=UPI00399014CF
MIDSKQKPGRKAPAPPPPAAAPAPTDGGGSAAQEREVSLAIPAAPGAEPEGAELVATGPDEEETFALPDRVGAAVATSEDAVKAALSKAHSIARGGSAPSGFGVTRSSVSVTNTTVTHKRTPTPVFRVRAKLKNTITWQVRTGAGPGGETHIGSARDPGLTAADYATAVSDLTPDMSDLNGRPGPSSGRAT